MTIELKLDEVIFREDLYPRFAPSALRLDHNLKTIADDL